jgi:imidazolonepropionase-like amidohydrolase
VTSVLFRNCNVLDTERATLIKGAEVLVEGERIHEVSKRPIKAGKARVIDCGGRILMPGLIDAHVHVTAFTAQLAALETTMASLVTASARPILEGMLARGFTSVRDAGGADQGLAQAIEQGLFDGPRIFHAGRALSQTGGHADFRALTQMVEPCACCALLGGALGRIADGVPEVRRAVRDEIRKGATQIKIMASGGVASPTDPIAFTQYALEEIRAIVEEAEAAQTYVMAHAYTARAIARAVECGVRTIEHGNLIDKATAELMARKGAYLVPTLATYDALHRLGRKAGFPEESMRKLEDVRGQGLQALKIARAAGVKMGYGTDLLGEMHVFQSDEFTLRTQVLPVAEVIQSATAVNAEILLRRGQLGVVKAGAIADLLVVDGNPLDDVTLLQGQGRHLAAIMKAGKLYKNRLGR